MATGATITEGEVSRHFHRHEYRVSARATIHPLVGSKPTRASHLLTRDIGDGGISLLCPRQVAPGQRITLEMPDGRVLLAECRWCGRTDQGLFVVGCRFVKSA